MNYIYVGLGGFIGAVFRIWLGNIIYTTFPNDNFPYNTLIINYLGSYLLAFILFYSNKNNLKMGVLSFITSNKLKLAITTGFLGSFTTFSTFSIETMLLIKENLIIQAMIYISFSFIGGIIFAWLGLSSVKRLNNKKLVKGEYL